jgi:predicted lipoprotein with Yx(FWY)xxD motif
MDNRNLASDSGRTYVMGRASLLSPAVALLLSSVAVVLSAGTGRASVSSPVTVKVAFNKKLKKQILVDGRGRTLYLFTLDVTGTPTCIDDPTYHCVKAWPPLRTTGAPRAGKGVKNSLLRMVKRPDGGVQVSYNRHPLYYFRGGGSDYGPGDKKPGDVRGQNFVGVWFVVSPQGAAIR